MKASRGVLLLAAALFLWNLWGYDLWAPDEPYFAEGAREMLKDGQWAVPHVNGVVTTDKPPLFFWLIALFSLPLGNVSSLSARLPSALAAIGTVALTIRFGRRFFGEAGGALAGLLVATNYLVWDKARSSQIDSLLCFLILVALSAFEAYRAREVSGRRAGLLFWLACALAVLAKGPVGVILPLAIAILTSWADRRLVSSWRGFAPVAGPVVFAILLGIWVVSTEIWGHGEYSVWEAFREHAVGRALRGMHHRQPPWYYLEMLPVQLLPWSGLVPGGLWLAWKRRSPADRFLLVWAILVVAFFSLSTEKRDLYVLPAYPAFLLLATAMGLGTQGPSPAIDRRWLTFPCTFFAVAIALGGIALPALNARSEVLPTWIALILGAALAATGAVAARAAARDDPRALIRATAVGSVASYLVLATLVHPAMDRVKSARTLAEAIRNATATSRAAGNPVLGFDLSNLPEAIAFYGDGLYLSESSDPAELARHLTREDLVFAVLPVSALEQLPGPLRARVSLVDSFDLARRRILLVANGRGAGASR